MASPFKAPLPGGYAAVFAATLAVQFLLVAVSFPLGELFSATPLLHIDAAHHWYEVKVAADLAQQGKLVGYDPYFAAGYLGGIPYNPSAKPAAAIAALAGGSISPAVAFKLFSFAAALAAPLAIPLAARSLGLGAGVGAVAAFLTLILWWASPVRWYHTAGIVAWPVAVFMASWFAAALAAYASGRSGTRAFAGAAALGCVMFFVHPLFPLAAFFALAPLAWIVYREALPRRIVAILVVLPLACLVFNLPWLLAMKQTPGMADGMQPYQQAVDIAMIWRDLLGLPSAGRGSMFYFVLAFFAAWGVFGARDGAERRLAAALALGGVATVVFADLGAALPAAAVVQPNRFSFQAYVLLLLPAALGVYAIARRLRTSHVALAGAAFGVLAIAFYLNEVRRELAPLASGHYGKAPPEVREAGPATRWVLEQLQRETDGSARVMFEQSHARVHDGGHMAGLLAVQSDREFIGGQYPYMHFANAWDDWMFGRAVDAVPPARFQEYLRLYNIGWIVAHSKELKRYLAGIPSVSLVSSREPLAFYRVAIDHTFFVQGTGRVVARAINRIDLADLNGEVIVLKYHYFPGMRTEPEAQIDGVRLLDDPGPFVRITRAPAALRLYMP